MDLPQNSRKALETMRSVVQNLRKAGIHADEWVSFIPFIITRKMDMSTHRDFDLSLQNPKQPVTINTIKNMRGHGSRWDGGINLEDSSH